MALIGRLAILGAAGAAAAWFLKQRQGSQESSWEAGPSGQESAGGDATRVSDVVVPDTGSDPLVRRQEQAAAAEAGAIGGTPETTQSGDDPAHEPADPAMKPVVEAAGEDHEALVEDDAARGVSREREGSDRPAP